MKKCIDSRTFNSFLEDSLDPKSLARMESHCRTCESCAAKLKSWKRLKEELSRQCRVDVPGDFKARVMSRISAERIMPAPGISGRRHHLAALLLFAAALCFIFQPYVPVVLNPVVTGIVKAFSAATYNFIGLMGYDPARVFRFFGNIMENMAVILPFSATITVITTVAFVLLITRRKPVRRAG